ncbi:KAP family P-loop domain-containing protein [Yoonia tamlensis]|uniref:KAP family P-loop domain-containing protein n=1 Tax=Yoonia tamlensis TaxID=390270 RepID=A0A1I6FQ39_9RHOB|nr:P-loop NTPase fold protein [Yoonia tamlensis]SFR32060.1 KAP family P-loop domain-containing protein [Yoonia tamlensis]
MKLTIPEPKITLYKDGLNDHDKLDRKPMATKLSNLVERIDDPLVIALDGGWGSGKSVFLKCWVGEHLKTHPNKATTLYFDAFEHDYLDDPLIALTGALAERLEDEDTTHALLQTLRQAAFKLLPMAARLGAAALTSGVSTIAEPAVTAIVEQATDNVEDAAKAYWKREDGRRAAMEEFRDALTALTKPDENNAPIQKLVIVIDELDRCRPDYALQMLEVIKHFFATPGVHFVLGTNMQELANSVRARYGAGIDAERYLHKFVQITMPMRQPRTGAVDTTRHFVDVATALGLSSGIVRLYERYLMMVGDHNPVTLRDVERLGTLLAVTPINYSKENYYTEIVAGFVIIQVLKPEWIKLARKGALTHKNMCELFNWQGSLSTGTHGSTLDWIWRVTLSDKDQSLNWADVNRKVGDVFLKFIEANPNYLPNIIAESLDAFELPD